jgi:hypothetical protein
LFGALKQHLGDRRFHSNEEVQMAVLEWLRFKIPISTATEFLTRAKMGKCISVLGDYVEKL